MRLGVYSAPFIYPIFVFFFFFFLLVSLDLWTGGIDCLCLWLLAGDWIGFYFFGCIILGFVFCRLLPPGEGDVHVMGCDVM